MYILYVPTTIIIIIYIYIIYIYFILCIPLIRLVLYSRYFNLANLASSSFFANISYRKYYKNDHIFAGKYNTSFTLYLKYVAKCNTIQII